MYIVVELPGPIASKSSIPGSLESGIPPQADIRGDVALLRWCYFLS